MEVISFPRTSMPHRWRPDVGVTQGLPAWQPAARPVASTMGYAQPRQQRQLGQVTPGEVANVTLVTLAALGAGFAGIALTVISPKPGFKIAGAITAAFGLSGLLNQVSRF